MRSRNLKPGFFKNPDIATLSDKAKLLFQGLWCLADAEGRLKDDARIMKAEIFPYENIDVEPLLDELENSPGDFIHRYEVNKQKIIQVTNFYKHQNPHKNEKAKGSDFPPCIEFCDASTLLAPDSNGTSTVLVGRNPDSLLRNPDSCHPHPESLQSDDADDFSENKPALAPNAGVYFQIDNRGDQLDEEEWLYRCFLQRRRDKKLSTVGCDSLTSLLSLYPNHYEQYRRWVTLPIAVRMTAFAIAYLKSAPDDPLKYVAWMVENKDQVKDWNQFYAITAQAVKKNDLKVTINA